METITVALFFLLAVVVSGALARMSPVALPLPLVQIALGAFIASVVISASTEADIFFLCSCRAALLGWLAHSEGGLFRDKGTILKLALGLVVFTVVGVGYFINWMIPAMPLAVAFALAAIVSPTDSTAVSAIGTRVPIPRRLMHILEGESLLNDASGLVCMRFAVAAARTGTFSLPDALGTFLWLAVGGIAIGVSVTWIAAVAKNWVSRHFGEETGSQILISLLIPFGAYLLAEHLHCSGILAAVAAGITMSYVEQGGGRCITRVRRSAVWDLVQFTVSGIIFVLLGNCFRSSSPVQRERVVREAGHHEPIGSLCMWLPSVSPCGVGFIWVWTSLRFALFRAALRSKPICTKLASHRGDVARRCSRTITLAGVLTLPLTMTTGPCFRRATRDLSRCWRDHCRWSRQSFSLPLLLKGLNCHLSRRNRKRRTGHASPRRKRHSRVEQAQHHMGKGRGDIYPIPMPGCVSGALSPSDR